MKNSAKKKKRNHKPSNYDFRPFYTKKLILLAAKTSQSTIGHNYGKSSWFWPFCRSTLFNNVLFTAIKVDFVINKYIILTSHLIHTNSLITNIAETFILFKHMANVVGFRMSYRSTINTITCSNSDTQVSGGSMGRLTFSLNSTNITIKVDKTFHRPLIICVRFSHKNNSYFIVNRF